MMLAGRKRPEDPQEEPTKLNATPRWLFGVLVLAQQGQKPLWSLLTSTEDLLWE
jgi:hypothetical protein